MADQKHDGQSTMLVDLDENGGHYPLVALRADARQGALASGTWTLQAGVVTSINLPAGTRYVLIRSASQDVRFAIDEDPAAEGSDAFATGATARADVDTVRLVEAGAAQLRLLHSRLEPPARLDQVGARPRLGRHVAHRQAAERAAIAHQPHAPLTRRVGAGVSGRQSDGLGERAVTTRARRERPAARGRAGRGAEVNR